MLPQGAGDDGQERQRAPSTEPARGSRDAAAMDAAGTRDSLSSDGSFAQLFAGDSDESPRRKKTSDKKKKMEKKKKDKKKGKK